MLLIFSVHILVSLYGIVYHLHVCNGNESIIAFGLSWHVIVAVMIILKIVSLGRRKFSADFQTGKGVDDGPCCRSTCGLDLERICFHGSDSPQSAAREILFLSLGRCRYRVTIAFQ
ncbi:hypothetical protein MKW98_016947 [Papaver atlanticum]|uniref:Transmembrane protein n=1 Tax=Papaver atlanticum TaxID=357466 RepID=A0AAD4TH19_9MAGN|nr:hypothetical protein MKW98_016947 [Papaver atlanticum]